MNKKILSFLMTLIFVLLALYPHTVYAAASIVNTGTVLVSTASAGIPGYNKKAKLLKHSINKLSKTKDCGEAYSGLALRKFMVIHIACPVAVRVDVRVEHNEEVLSSAFDNDFNDRTSFGSIEFLGIQGEIKAVILKDMDEGPYNIELTGKDLGSMKYEIRYFDECENEIGVKEFINIPVTRGMRGYISTANSAVMHLDYDDNGHYEHSLFEGNHASLRYVLGIAKPIATYPYYEENINLPSSSATATNTSSDFPPPNRKKITQRKIKDSGNRATIIHRNVSKFPIFAEHVAYGWNISTDGNWYYILEYNSNRPMFKTGWHAEEAEGALYYLSPKDGRMLTGEQVIDDKIYKFRESGTHAWQYNDEKQIWEYIGGESKGKLYETR